MKNSKGFTIIELLVVVAIIAVLAAIVLFNVTSYINKGKDSAVKGNLSTVLIQSAVYYDSNGNYGTTVANGLCGTPIVASALAAANTASGGTATCTYNVVMPATATAFCACSPEKTTANTFCIDSTGLKKEYTNSSTCATDCPATGACL